MDLHNKEFCVDVSTYQPVIWVDRDGEECRTEFVKQCEDKSENVCAEVTETKCEVSLYKLLAGILTILLRSAINILIHILVFIYLTRYARVLFVQTRSMLEFV